MQTQILVLDDDQTLLSIIQHVLRAAGHKCFMASSPETALQFAAVHDEIKVIITDIYMPRMDGFQFVKALKDMCLHRLPPQILMLTGEPSVQTAIDALRIGACDFLTKPVSPEELVTAVRRAIERANSTPNQALATAMGVPGIPDLIHHAQELVDKLQAASMAQVHDAAMNPMHNGLVVPESSMLDTMIALRQIMCRISDKHLDDHAWDLLLEIARSENEGREISVSDLMISGTGASSTTLLRRINMLEKLGYVAKKPDPKDGRRDFVILTPKGQELITSFLRQAVQQAGLPFSQPL